MDTKETKDLGIMMNVLLELAREIFRESGDLPFAKFPAMMTLADSIGKAMDIDHDESVARPKPTISHKRSQNYPLSTR